MNRLPTLPDKLDNVVRRFLQDLLATLASDVLDCTTYKLRVTWSVPFVLSAGDRRQSPEIVRVGRIQSLTDPNLTVTPGLPRWTWTGDAVRILDIPGLVVGQRYDIVFEVVG